MSAFQILNKAIADTASHYKIHDRQSCFRDAVYELRNDEDYFKSICSKDIAIEEKLHQQLQTSLAPSPAIIAQIKVEIELSILCLNGHIAKLELRRSQLTIALAMLVLSLPVWAKLGMSDGLLLMVFVIVVCALPLWVLIGNIDKRVFFLKRTADHLKFIADHP